MNPLFMTDDAELTATLRGWVDKQVAPFSMHDVAAGALDLRPEQVTRGVSTRIGIALRKLGCTRLEDRLAVDPSRRRLYRPSTGAGGR